MSIEGGAFQCYIHTKPETQKFYLEHNGKKLEQERVVQVPFETTSVKEWNEHCTSSKHTEEGSTRCRDCDKVFNFKNLPFKPFDDLGHKNISLSCPDCQGNQQYEIVEVDGE